ncbi:hypothetical protein B7Y94_02425 [Candidatus Saccharibacteria bacterium 32-49-12]|nr:MAG: hypothetical protein B7Y94_02425 [Candidatus Saccharibacteria bacterium 32-49-12]
MDNMLRRPSQPNRELNETRPQPISIDQPVNPYPNQPAIQTENLDNSSANQKPSSPKRRWGLMVAGFVLILTTMVIGAVYWWYSTQLSAVDSADDSKKVVRIVSGSTPPQIGNQLEEAGLIKDGEAFDIYTRIKGVQGRLQAGTYRLSPSESTPEIVEHLINGRVDTFSITFIPGLTLKQIREVIKDAGYTDAEIDKAMTSDYDSPIFDGKPAGQDLEGYIYPETYQVSSSATVEQILKQAFAEFEKVIKANDLAAKYKEQGLTLYEGIIMASIIQKEAVGGDEAQIAQVFLKRYAEGMALGSDPTYQYIADKLGVERDLNLDSPYNTRRFTGLPPGPIANSSETVLVAVAEPAEGDYLYFLSGDDDVTYFSRTLAEHEANIRDYCKVKCSYL